MSHKETKEISKHPQAEQDFTTLFQNQQYKEVVEGIVPAIAKAKLTNNLAEVIQLTAYQLTAQLHLNGQSDLVEMLQSMNEARAQLKTAETTKKEEVVVHKNLTETEAQTLQLQKALALEQQIARDTLKQRNEDWLLFARVAAHDLKEPLRMIISFSQIIGRLTQNNEELTEYLQYIIRSGNQMQHMINDLITYATSGIEKEEEPAMSIDLNKILEMVLRSYTLTIRQLGARINVDTFPTLIGHKSFFIQLFNNIIHNTFKFSKKDVPPVIDITSEETSDQWIFKTTDNGIGIEEDKLPKVFEPFRRLHTRQEYEGSGLGLSTCYKIVQAYGGSIHLDSVFGQGTTVVVQLPK